MSKILYPGMLDYVIKRLIEEETTNNIYEEVIAKFDYPNTRKAFTNYIHKVKRTHFKWENDLRVPSPLQEDDEVTFESDFMRILKEEGTVSIIELSNQLDCPPKDVYQLVRDFRQEGYEILCDEFRVSLGRHDFEPVEKFRIAADKQIILAIASDLHFGSGACQITRLHQFCDECRKVGVKHIFVPGDVTAGYNVYKGQENEIYAYGAERQENSLIRNLPEGFQWYMLGGNHDHTFISKGGGHNPLRVIEREREDCHYIGMYNARIEILKGVDMMLWHPQGSVSYALSYKLQKQMEKMAIEELYKKSLEPKSPTIKILAAGHYHQNLSYHKGGVLNLMSGAFEGSNSLTERMGVIPSIGGWIIELWFDGEVIVDYNQRFWPRPEIKDDWKHYDHSEIPQKELGTIFEPR